MRFRKTTAGTVAKDLRTYADYLDQKDMPTEMREEAAKILNDHLDDLMGQDAFGTEGQHDPRGDHRD